ncbi:hypothetical protein POTOM_013062 [Populus tomentosa]|uniref:Uncharacterized protein n=1 Tax=Populus tomentosa TaxID=118781 RepID=A0A8X7ZZQ1_POPTO|nr:hypothetical protein POTOM_013062 [Populus tomentosa]
MEGEWSCWSRSENPTFCSRWRQGCSREEELPDVASMEAERVFGCRAATAIAALGGRSYGERGFDGLDGRELQWRRLQLGWWLGSLLVVYWCRPRCSRDGVATAVHD